METEFSRRYIFLEELKAFSGYSERRTVQKWLAGMGLQLVKLGKLYVTDRESFEKVFGNMPGHVKRLQRSTYRPRHPMEIQFLIELASFLNESSPVVHANTAADRPEPISIPLLKTNDAIELQPDIPVPGLHIRCKVCGTTVRTCKKNGKDLSECENIRKLQYRAVIHIPGSKNGCVIRVLSNDFNTAVQQLTSLRERVKKEKEDRAAQKLSHLHNSNSVSQKIQVLNEQSKPTLLIHLLGRYLAALNGEGVASHLKIDRSKGHVHDVKNCFKHFCLALKLAGYDLETFYLSDISDYVVGAFYDYILRIGCTNHRYNKLFSYCTSFTYWAEREDHGNAKRFFERVPRRKVIPRPEIISSDEFEKLISVITPENSFYHKTGLTKQNRYYYRYYLIPAYYFALYTGRRMEEILTVKFSDIHTDKAGKPRVIVFTDHKVSRILRLAKGEEHKVYTPVTGELAAFLDKQGFQEKKQSDDFILTPELVNNRVSTMRYTVARGFTHFWKVAYPDSMRKITFKTLRKTYLTSLAIQMGKDVRGVSGHTSEQILKHYIDEKTLAIAASLRGFSVFGWSEE